MGVSYTNTDIFALARNIVNVPLAPLQTFFTSIGQKVGHFFPPLKR